MASHGYNTRGNQRGISDLNQPSAPSSPSPSQVEEENLAALSTPKVSEENDSEPTMMDSPLTSIASDEGPSNNFSTPAGPEPTASAGPVPNASAGPEPAPSDGTPDQEMTSASTLIGGNYKAAGNNAPGQGTSKDKGKGPDLRNWGGARLNEADIDPEIQAQIYNSLQYTKERMEKNQERLDNFEQWKAMELRRMQIEIQSQFADRIQELEEQLRKQKNLRILPELKPLEGNAENRTLVDLRNSLPLEAT
ncbi:hypothetical protein DFH05DRAFT_1457906 [Lentinula detonsa]|uniref:Uncharacterized protein n=1 Tax=Lentinula detonsa TaxID=2804962 RepID=A0A9W8U0K0_9AGAR|nr:hypothetical protein DFH05DRAFT_1457906 [Lentinula detonsa]